MQYRRSRSKGGTYFFTVVTDRRRKFLCEPDNIDLLRTIFTEVKERHPFTIDAIVILPDHLHCLLTLPTDDNNYSTRWRLIKSAFSRRCHARYRGVVNKSRKKKKEQAVWQRRYWEHAIRDENDFRQHVAYIHYNPVKHGLSPAPENWAFSSIHEHIRKGLCQPGWGAGTEIRFTDDIGRE